MVGVFDCYWCEESVVVVVSSVSPAKVDVQQRAVQARARGERLLCTVGEWVERTGTRVGGSVVAGARAAKWQNAMLLQASSDGGCRVGEAARAS